jgi:hypothetical protein
VGSNLRKDNFENFESANYLFGDGGGGVSVVPYLII